MFELDNQENFSKVLDFQVPWAHTWADMRKGKTDLERRENFRQKASGKLGPMPAQALWWAFRIIVCKSGRKLDVDNVPKPIIDSFCKRQIEKDGSIYKALGLYPDDTFDHVRLVQVAGAPSTTTTTTSDSTRIQIYACIKDITW